MKNTHGGVLLLVKLQAKALLYECFPRFLNCINGTKLFGAKIWSDLWALSNFLWENCSNENWTVSQNIKLRLNKQVTVTVYS